MAIYELLVKILTLAFNSLTRFPYKEPYFGDFMMISLDFALHKQKVCHFSASCLVDLLT